MDQQRASRHSRSRPAVMAGPYGPRYSGAGEPQASPYGFQGGEPHEPALPVQPEQRPLSEGAQQEARWLEQQRREEAEQYDQQQPQHGRGSSYGGQDPYAGAQDPYAGGQDPYQQQGRPYAAYPHEAPYQQAPEQASQRLTDDEYFDPYAPAAGARHSHRRTSSTEGGYPTYFAPIYQVTICLCHQRAARSSRQAPGA